MRVLKAFSIFLAMMVVGCATQPHLPIVRTYGDLLAQKPIVVEAEPYRGEHKPQVVTLRLGQSATSAPVNSAVLLYCFVENYDILSCRTGADRFGPLWVSQSYEGGPNISDLDSKHHTGYVTMHGETTKDAKMVLTRTIMIDRPGIYHIQFKSIDGKVVSKTTITGTKKIVQPWLPFKMISEGDWGLFSDRHADDTYDVKTPMEVSFPGRGAALPLFSEQAELYSGTFSMFTKGEDRHKPSDFLPTLTDEEVTLKLEKNGDLFRITTADINYNTRVDFAYLSRWWVNGKPFVPPPGIPELTSGSILMSGHRNLPFILFLDPSVLGARPGDILSLQLLRCEQWEFVSRPNSGGNGTTGELTNRISWVVP